MTNKWESNCLSYVPKFPSWGPRFSIHTHSIMKGGKRKLPSKTSIVDYMDQCIKKHKKAQGPALIYQRKATHTFQSLEELSNQIAHVLSTELTHIISSNKNNDFIIAFSLRPNDKTIVLILAILKLGAAYMSLDIKWSPDKLIRQVGYTKPIAIIIEDDMEIVARYSCVTKATKVISISHVYTLAQKFQRFPLDSVIQRRDLRPFTRRGRDNGMRPKSFKSTWNGGNMLANDNNNNNIDKKKSKLEIALLFTRTAAVVFTSGSSSHPQAVRLSHQCIINLIKSSITSFSLDLNNDVYTLSSPLSSAFSVQEIFIPLTQGIPLVVLPRNQMLRVPELLRLINKNKITKITMEPVHLKLFLTYLIENERGENTEQIDVFNIRVNKTRSNPTIAATKKNILPKELGVVASNPNITNFDLRRTIAASSATSNSTATSASSDPVESKNISKSFPSLKMKTETPVKSRSKTKIEQKLPHRPLDKLSSLKYIVCTGYPLSAELASLFFKVFDNLNWGSKLVPTLTPIKTDNKGSKKVVINSIHNSSQTLEKKTEIKRLSISPPSQTLNSKEFIGSGQVIVGRITKNSKKSSGHSTSTTNTSLHRRRSKRSLRSVGSSTSNLNFPSIKVTWADGDVEIDEKWKEKVTKSPKAKEICTSTCWLVHSYGTAEVTGEVSFEIFYGWQDYLNKVDRSLVTLGKPIDNVMIYILSPQMSILPLREKGEICISGTVVSSGYCGSYESPKFVKNPFSKSKKFSILFRTGDLGRMSVGNDGIRRLHFIKTSHSEVAVNGVVYDLNLITRFISETKLVTDCVVVCYHQDLPDQRIVAACVLIPTSTLHSIRVKLRDHLKHKFVIEVFPIQSLPFQHNGTVDKPKILTYYNQLREMEISQEFLNPTISSPSWTSLFTSLFGKRTKLKEDKPSSKERERTSPQENLVSATTATVATDKPGAKSNGKSSKLRMHIARDLCMIISKIISVSPQHVLDHFRSSFYELGGDSRNSFEVVSAIEIRGYFINIHDFVKYASISLINLLDKIVVIVGKTRHKRLSKIASSMTSTSLMLAKRLYAFAPVEEIDRHDVYNILTSAYVNKSILCLYSHVKEKEFRKYLDLVWTPCLESCACVGAKSNATGKFHGIVLGINNKSRLRLSKLPTSVRYIVELYQHCAQLTIQKGHVDTILSLHPRFVSCPAGLNFTVLVICRQTIEAAKSRILLVYLYGSLASLKPEENVILADILLSEAVDDLPVDMYDIVLVLSENPIVKQMCADLMDYNLILEYPAHQFIASDRSKPFKFVPSYHNVIVYCRYLDEP